jgi:hypothetical protein
VEQLKKKKWLWVAAIPVVLIVMSLAIGATAGSARAGIRMPDGSQSVQLR